MGNSIAKFKKYIDLLDEVYKRASLTSGLDSDATLVRAGANANEIIIPKLSMDGLADYSRNSGYVSGDVTLTNETVQFNFDRGRKFSVDAMDNEETAGLAFGKLSAEFIRTKVVPEMDAFRFATYAGTPDIGSATGTLSTGADAYAALRAATNEMDEAEVPTEGRILYITPTLAGLISDLDLTKSREVMSRFSTVVNVPQSRFYTAIEQYDGTSSGETAGGYEKAVNKQEFTATANQTDFVVTAKPDEIQAVVSGTTVIPMSNVTYAKATGTVTIAAQTEGTKVTVYYNSGADINFLIARKDAVMQYSKHVVDKIFTPDQNQNADAWIFCFRSYGLADVYENKTAGLYCHHKAVV